MVVRPFVVLILLGSLLAAPGAALLGTSPAPLADAPGPTAADLEVGPVRHAEGCRPTTLLLSTSAAGPTDLVTGTCNGIRPGARVFTPGGACTMSWILTDGTALYATIAGHCARVGDRITLAQTGRAIGTMVYSVDQPIGEDFGLFRIDDEDRTDVSASLCAWGGATGVYESGATLPDGDVVVHQFGYGTGFGSIPPARARSGVFYYENGAAFAYQGAASPGDSGSPARLGDGRALGVVTDLTSVRTPGTGPLVPDDTVLLTTTVAGTLLDHGIDRVAETLGIPLTLVTAAIEVPPPQTQALITER